MPLEVLLAWWNLIYVVPFLLAVVYLGLFVFTGVTFGDTDLDGPDMDADGDIQVEAHVVEADVDADADMDTDADIDADADADADAEADAHVHGPHTALAHAHAAPSSGLMPHMAHAATADMDAGTSFFTALLTLLGIGKIPLSLAMMIFMLSWGFVGFALTALLTQWFGANALIILVTLPVTFLLSCTLTGLLAAGVAKVIPPDEESKERNRDLVGRPGEAMFDINETFGMARVRGRAGDFLQVSCRTAAGKPPISKGARIVLFDYDREKNVFTVAPFDASSTTG